MRRKLPAVAAVAILMSALVAPTPARGSDRAEAEGRVSALAWSVLIVQNLRDPATPWVSAVGMRRALGSDAVLLSVDQGGHTAYLTTNSTCANDTTTAFLTRGELPPGPLSCPGQPLPA